MEDRIRRIVECLEAEARRCDEAAESYRKSVERDPWDDYASAAMYNFKDDAECFRKAIKIVLEE